MVTGRAAGAWGWKIKFYGSLNPTIFSSHGVKLFYIFILSSQNYCVIFNRIWHNSFCMQVEINFNFVRTTLKRGDNLWIINIQRLFWGFFLSQGQHFCMIKKKCAETYYSREQFLWWAMLPMGSCILIYAFSNNFQDSKLIGHWWMLRIQSVNALCMIKGSLYVAGLRQKISVYI